MTLVIQAVAALALQMQKISLPSKFSFVVHNQEVYQLLKEKTRNDKCPIFYDIILRYYLYKYIRLSF